MIKFNKVSKKFADGTVALEKISFEIENGEFVFLVGPTGAGKTTIFRLLTREIESSGGKIEVDGEDVGKLRPKHVFALRRKIGRVFQDLKLLPDRTVWENAALVLEIFGYKKKEIEERVKKVLSSLAISRFRNKFPVQISGGELQRAAIARAIVGEPGYLLCDEPTADLDPETTWEIIDILKRINKKGTTVVFATHDVDIVNSMKKRVIRIEKGKVVKDDKEGKYE